jgi:hypothetical protein
MGSIRIIINPDVDRALSHTSITPYTLCFVKFQTIHAKSVEEGKNCAQRTYRPAEGPFDESECRQKRNKDTCLNPEHGADLAPHLVIEESERYSRLQKSGRAQLAEPRLARNIRDNDNQTQQQNVLKIIKRFRHLYLFCCDFEYQILHETERAEPSACHPSYDTAN